MTKLYDLKEIIKATGLPERTVRYYLSQVLEAPSGTPGRKSYYDQLTVDQLMLAQQILMRDYDPEKGEVKPTLSEFRDWLDGLSEDEVRRLVEMPYRVKPKALTQGRTVLRSAKGAEREPTFGSAAPQAPDDDAGRVMYSPPPDHGRVSHSKMLDASLESAAKPSPGAFGSKDLPDTLKPSDKEDRKANTTSQTTGRDSATDYLDRVLGTASKDPDPGIPDWAKEPPPWETHRFGDTLEIRTRQPLTQEQARQVYLAGELLKSILKSHR